MPDRVKELADQSRSRPPEERVRLMDLLLESLYDPASDELDGAWSREIERRVAQYERGESESYDAEAASLVGPAAAEMLGHPA